MIIDCHGHYTTAPKEVQDYRDAQLAAAARGEKAVRGSFSVTDDQIRESIEKNQLKMMNERGSDVTIFSPRAASMEHHAGTPETTVYWTEHLNDLIHRVCTLFPKKFIGMAMLPQAPGVRPDNTVKEMERAVNELGCVGINLNPDPSGGYWTDPPLTDEWWYPVYEKMVELDIPAMVHVSTSCNPNFHYTGSHYINADTTAFMQFITGSDLFKRFPTLKFLIPHGGGAVPYHWGRYRGLTQNMNKGLLDDLLMKNVYFDTCVYHQPGIDLLCKVINHDNILFASEMIGAVRGIDPQSGQDYDDTKKYILNADMSEEDRQKIFEGNAMKLYGERLQKQLA